MKRWLLATVCGVAALGLMLYPLAGELLSERYHSDIETTYTAAIADTDDVELTAQREAAERYNAMLSGAATITEGGASAPPLAYAQQLTVGGVMAYVDIPKINVYLPVQHGTEADTLEKSVGHVVGTSLPVAAAAPMRCCRLTAAWRVPNCFRTSTSLQRAMCSISMCWVTLWPTK